MKQNTLAMPAQGVPRKKRKKWNAFDVVNLVVLVLFAAVCLFPFLYELFLSFASLTDYLNAKVMVLPLHFNFESYKIIFFRTASSRRSAFRLW